MSSYDETVYSLNNKDVETGLIQKRFTHTNNLYDKIIYKRFADKQEAF